MRRRCGEKRDGAEPGRGGAIGQRMDELCGLRRLKPPGVSDWDAFESHLHWPLRPEKARGAVFQREARRAAGLSEEFIERLERSVDGPAGGRHT